MKLTIQVASLPDREKVVAEIWFGNQQLAEVSQEAEILKVELYPQPNRGVWELELDELIAALQKAKDNLSV